jgi:hypothetical protein
MMKKWFARRDPLLHRALGGGGGTSSKDGITNNDSEKDSMLNVHELATKRRVRQKDKLKRNALHVAVRTDGNGTEHQQSGRFQNATHFFFFTFTHCLSHSLLDRRQCAHQPTLELVQLLYERYPMAVDEADQVGRLPLHTACSNRADVRVVEYLLEVFPDAIHETTDRGVRARFFFCFSYCFYYVLCVALRCYDIAGWCCISMISLSLTHTKKTATHTQTYTYISGQRPVLCTRE